MTVLQKLYPFLQGNIVNLIIALNYLKYVMHVLILKRLSPVFNGIYTNIIPLYFPLTSNIN